MKSTPSRTGLLLCFAVLLATALSAQRPKTVRRTTSTAQPQKTTDTIPIGFAGLPIIMDTLPQGDTENPSLRPTTPFGPVDSANRLTPLPYPYLRADDALYAEKVWRELDLREKMNQTFRYDAVGDGGSHLFASMLLNAVKAGEVTAFEDDRFSIPLSATQAADLTQGSLDTVMRYDPTTMKPTALVVTKRSFDPKSIMRMRIMEEWVFDRNTSRMHCRILGIAPMKSHILEGGKEAWTVMFWVYYPDLRPMLVNSVVYNPKNMGASRMTWEDLFESHMFSSYIVKSTIDNPGNKAIRAYIKDPVMALLEGENIKNKIFNYEEDLWSY